jgi:ubiquinone/menaquinone biosynthesis C-methylase UbiE
MKPNLDRCESNNTPFEQLAYELNEIWDEDWFPREDYDRIQALARLIPDNNKTVLDVGCGNGLFLNYLKTECSNRFEALLGIDRSEAALAHVQTDKHLANIDCIPIDDLQFDTVTCMEVLEHLPIPTYSRALEEIARISRRTIIICVPYREDLKASHCECPICFTSFSPDYHVRSFDEEKLKTLFPEHSFKIAGIHYLGPQIGRYDYELRARIRSMVSRTFPGLASYAICPVCGFFDKNRLSDDLASRKRVKVNVKVEDVGQTRMSGARRFLRSLLTMPPRYRWIAAVYYRIDLTS